jgi:hypothetical protein
MASSSPNPGVGIELDRDLEQSTSIRRKRQYFEFILDPALDTDSSSY